MKTSLIIVGCISLMVILMSGAPRTLILRLSNALSGDAAVQPYPVDWSRSFCDQRWPCEASKQLPARKSEE